MNLPPALPSDNMNKLPTILIVDDEAANLGVLSNYLEQAGYRVLIARDGESGWEKAQYAQPDLILLDVLMPGIDGFELCRRLQADHATKDIPVIFMTILEDTKDKIKGLALGGVDYIAKPFQQEEVLARVATHLRIRRLTKELEMAKASLETQVEERTYALQASETRYRALYHDNPSMFFTVDSKGTILSANSFAADQLGYTVDELEGQPLLKLYYEAEHTAVLTQYQHCLQTPGQVETWHFRKMRKDGTLLWAEEFVRPVIGTTGEVQVLIVCQDISARKQSELEKENLLKQIQNQVQQVQYIIDTVPEGVLLLSEAGQVRLTNPVAQRFLHLLAPDWENGRLTHLGATPLKELLTSPPKGLWHEISVDSYYFEVIARPVENGPTNPGWVLVLRDVTQGREIERRIQEQERLAAVGQLAAGIAHDFNNILAVITLYTQVMLQNPDLETRLNERLQIIEEQSYRASNLIQQILDFSRQSIMEQQPLDMVSFFKELIRLLKRTLPEDIQIDLTHGPENYIIFADLSRIQQVFMNLAVNARDAMPTGGRLTFQLEKLHITKKAEMPLPGMSLGSWIHINVADNGLGIPDEIRPHIFEPFFTTKSVGKGTGLGLAQVYGIIQQHQGYIDVQAKDEQGTAFSLYLPAYVTDSSEEAAMFQSLHDDLPQGQGQTVLLVEDEAATRQALLDSLMTLNYAVLEAPNGREALMLLEQRHNEIALILSDAVMPEMGGIALFHAVRELGISIPFVILTGHVIERDREALRAQGLDGWLTKPPDLAKLAGLLAHLLSE